MKRLILSALLLAFTSIFVFGCSDSSDDSGPAYTPTYTPIDLNNPPTLAGTYDITFFATDGSGVSAVTSDCNEFKKYFSTPVCVPEANQTSMKGEAVIKVDEANRAGTLITKIQMAEEGPYGKEGAATLGGKGNEIYNYTVYSPVSDVDPVTKMINGNGLAKGTTGRNLNSNVSSPNDEYVLKLQDDSTLLVEMVKKGIQYQGMPLPDVNVRVVMKKKSNTPVELNQNEAYATPVISGFVKDIQ